MANLINNGIISQANTSTGGTRLEYRILVGKSELVAQDFCKSNNIPHNIVPDWKINFTSTRNIHRIDAIVREYLVSQFLITQFTHGKVVYDYCSAMYVAKIAKVLQCEHLLVQSFGEFTFKDTRLNEISYIPHEEIPYYDVILMVDITAAPSDQVAFITNKETYIIAHFYHGLMGKSGFKGEFFVDFLNEVRYVYVNGLDNPLDYYTEPAIPWFYCLERSPVAGLGTQQIVRLNTDTQLSTKNVAMLTRRFRNGTKPNRVAIDPPYFITYQNSNWKQKLKKLLKNPKISTLELDYDGIYEDEIVSQMLKWAAGKDACNQSLPHILERYFYTEIFPRWHKVISVRDNKQELMIIYRYLCQSSIKRTIHLKSTEISLSDLTSERTNFFSRLFASIFLFFIWLKNVIVSLIMKIRNIGLKNGGIVMRDWGYNLIFDQVTPPHSDCNYAMIDDRIPRIIEPPRTSIKLNPERLPTHLAKSNLTDYGINFHEKFLVPNQYTYKYWGFATPFVSYGSSPDVQSSMCRRILKETKLRSIVQNIRIEEDLGFSLTHARTPPPNEDPEEMFKNWVKDHPKKTLYIRERSKNILSSLLLQPCVIECFSKSDELLLKWNRIICAVPPIYSAYLGPYVNVAFSNFKEYISDFRPIQSYYPDIVGEIDIYGLVASGLRDTEFDQHFENFYTHCTAHPDRTIIFIMVAGDDSLIIKYQEGVTRYFCSDFSKYDQSQCIQSLILTQNVLYHFGLPRDIYALISKIHNSKLRVYASRKQRDSYVEWDMSARAQFLYTGTPLTTANNSILNFVMAIKAYTSPNGIAQTYETFGFEIKLNEYNRLSQCDFLKGHFVQHNITQKWRWAVGLGTVSKFGASMTSVNILYPGKTSYEEKWRRRLSEVANGWEPFLQVPFLRVITDKFVSKKYATINRNEYQVMGGFKEDIDAYDMTDYLSYYDLTWDVVTNLEKRLRACPLGQVVDSGYLPRIYRDYA